MISGKYHKRQEDAALLGDTISYLFKYLYQFLFACLQVSFKNPCPKELQTRLTKEEWHIPCDDKRVQTRYF
jgi:hypothetical protein